MIIYENSKLNYEKKIYNEIKSFEKKAIIILVLVILLKYNSNYYEEEKEIKPDSKAIYHIEKFFNYKEAFKRAKDFIDNILKDNLLKENISQTQNKPKISAVIPCHNCKNYIKYPILSIQNQNYSNLEIIIGNDFSTDGSLLFLEQLQKYDSRIKIINNNKNMGTLYTRTIITLISKGKYIFPIDSDDMFLNFDVFSTIINIADKGNFDILIFNSIISDLKPNVYSTKIYTHPLEKSHKSNLVLLQPNLGYYPIIPKPNFRGKKTNEFLIFAKCIKSKIYKKAINKLGKERYSRYMILGEDDIANYIIFNTANIAKFIPYYGYLHITRKGSVSLTKKNLKRRLLNNLYILDVVIEFSKELIKNKKIVVNYIISIFKNKKLKYLLSQEKHNKIFISCLDRILNCKYISLENKLRIRKIGKTLNFIKYNF